MSQITKLRNLLISHILRKLAAIQPDAARWDAAMGEFLLDYDDLRQSDDPDRDLLLFFESTYQAGAVCANWNPELVSSGKPV